MKDSMPTRNPTKASIELYEIPSIQDTMDKQDSNLLDKILKHTISDDALRVYEQIRGNADMTQLVCKLLSMVLQDSKVLGPNKIGLNKKDLNQLQLQLEDTPNRGGRKHSRSSNERESKKPQRNFRDSKKESRKGNFKEDSKRNSKRNPKESTKKSAKSSKPNTQKAQSKQQRKR